MSGLNQHFCLLARYNTWMNAKLYDAAAMLPPAALALDRGAFFGSIMGTLNHLVVADTIWLKRFAHHPAQDPVQHAALDPVRQLPSPAGLDAVLFTDLALLRQRRTLLDGAISAWTAVLTAEDLAHNLDYANTKGVLNRKNVAALLLHFFNHQTHHRGQVTTLLTQAGVDVGVTDLVTLIPNAP
ncbi:MAG: DinB family protein [Burkholderiaceae bacterium]